MYEKVVLGPIEGQEKLKKGIKELAMAVKSTLGPDGKYVVIKDTRNSMLGGYTVTKDGVTVANEVVLLDPTENLGATMIKEASKETNKSAGDGTTTAIVLTEAFLDGIDSVYNPSECNFSISKY